MSETSQDNTERVARCSHLSDEHFPWYMIVIIDNKPMALCRACYGDIVIQVLDNLKKVTVKVK